MTNAEKGNRHALHFDGRPGSYVSIPNMDMNRLTFATWVKRDVTRQKQYLIMPQSPHGWGVFFSERKGALSSLEPDNDYVGSRPPGCKAGTRMRP